MTQNSNIQIYHFIAQLLHPSYQVDIESYKFNQNFWDDLVKIASGHLVLPAIYVAAVRKKVIRYFPHDLINYLKNIHELNINRNNKIIEQINFISNLFKKHGIDYVYLKGAALLFSEKCNALDQRMIGDIDILITKEHINNARKILINNGFFDNIHDFKLSEDILNKTERHLNRITHPKYIAAVELHYSLLSANSDYYMDSENFIKNRIKTSYGHYIPNNNDLLKHTILNWQLNDNGIRLNSLLFKTVLDVLWLECATNNFNAGNSKHIIDRFYNLLGVYFIEYENYNGYYRCFYTCQLKSRSFNKLVKFYSSLRIFFSLILSRVKLFYDSSSYRKRLIQNPLILIQKIINFIKNTF